MDNTQQNGMNPQPVMNDGMQPAGVQDPNVSVAPAMDANPMPTQATTSMGDLAGMTPPPAPPMQDMSAQAPVTMPEPAPVQTMDASTMNAGMPSSPMGMPQQAQPVADMNTFSSPMHQTPASVPAGQTEADDYAYAEDLLDEILDSLDRIEAKLEAIEKKMG